MGSEQEPDTQIILLPLESGNQVTGPPPEEELNPILKLFPDQEMLYSQGKEMQFLSAGVSSTQTLRIFLTTFSGTWAHSRTLSI